MKRHKSKTKAPSRRRVLKRFIEEEEDDEREEYSVGGPDEAEPKPS